MKKEVDMKRLSFYQLIFLCLLLIFLLLSCSHGNSKNSVKQKNNDIRAVDLYRIEVAYKVSKNWEFVGNHNSKNKSLAAIAFTIFPDGEIKHIHFVKRSGDSAIDEAAYKAIKKTSPTIPFPKNVKEQEIEMGLRFDYNGVR